MGVFENARQQHRGGHGRQHGRRLTPDMEAITPSLMSVEDWTVMSPMQPTPPPDEAPLRTRDASANVSPPGDDAFLKSFVSPEEKPNGDDQDNGDQNGDENGDVNGDDNDNDNDDDQVKTQAPENEELVAELLPERKKNG